MLQLVDIHKTYHTENNSLNVLKGINLDLIYLNVTFRCLLLACFVQADILNSRCKE